MPLFVCEKCGAIENTALGYYWSARLQNMPRMCSECAPMIVNGMADFQKNMCKIRHLQNCDDLVLNTLCISLAAKTSNLTMSDCNEH